jgi:hypothetical protein
MDQRPYLYLQCLYLKARQQEASRVSRQTQPFHLPPPSFPFQTPYHPNSTSTTLHTSLCLWPCQQNNRRNRQNNTNQHHSSLNPKHDAYTIQCDPAGLEIANRKAAACAPHVDDCGHDGCVFGIFFECVGCYGAVGS